MNEWTVLVCAASARSLLEGAAYLNHELPIVIELWNKEKGTPRLDSLESFSDELNRRVTALQYSSRIGEVRRLHPEVLSKK
jgi:hypothetical protein